MRKSKIRIAGFVVATVVLLAAGLVSAHGPWAGKGYGYGAQWYGRDRDLSPEKRERLESMREKFYQEVSPLRRELYQKRLELRALWVDPKADSEEIRAKASEIFDLQRRLEEKVLAHRLAVRQVVPEGYFPPGRGRYGSGVAYGPGSGHMGRGAGFGASQGYRAQPCW